MRWTQYLHWLPLLGLLWLAGCANLAAPPGSEATPAQVEGTPEETSTTIADGPLHPITQGDTPRYTVTGIRPPNNLWERIGKGFAMPDLESDTVRERERWHASRPTYLEHLAERARKYLFYIVEEIERRNMPMELAFVPYIESSLNPTAVSRAKAMGLWQFMPATGASLGLKQNNFRDERRDIEASTNKALDYLQELYDEFGDWHLSLAAYNWGPGNVRKAIAENRKKGLGISYNELRLPQETRLYVPKIQALKNVVINPQEFSLELPPIANQSYYQGVEITRDIDVALAAELAQMSEEEFRELNPAVKGPVIFASVIPEIFLHWDNAEAFRSNLAARGGANPLATWTVWKAPKAMSVVEVAQRFGMSETQLRTLNGIPPSSRIEAGSTFLVPRPPTMLQDVSAALANHGQVKFKTEKPARGNPPRGAKTKAVAGKAKTKATAKLAVKTKVKPKAKASQKVKKPAAKTKAPSPKTKAKK